MEENNIISESSDDEIFKRYIHLRDAVHFIEELRDDCEDGEIMTHRAVSDRLNEIHYDLLEHIDVLKARGL